MHRITPFFWYATQAEEAAKHYVDTFSKVRGSSGGESKITGTTRYGEESAKMSGVPAGTVMTVSFKLDGQEFVALNGGVRSTFTDATSFVIYCDTQQEIDGFWERLSAGGEPGQCGWLKDRFGLSWQVVPSSLMKMLSSGEPAKIKRMMQALLQMKKLDLGVLEKAFDGR